MDDPLSRGLPFELADIWRRSTLRIEDEDHSLFAPLEASFPDLQLDTKPTDFGDDLFIPPLADANDFPGGLQHLEPPESEVASPPSELWDTGQSAPDDPAIVWDLDLNLDSPLDVPRLRTWEAFEKKNVPNAQQTAFLSEAGPGAFDALLARREGSSNGVLPQDVMLRALCNLALGRTSVFFQWDEQMATFNRTLKDVLISGYSSAASDSLIQLLVDYATLYRPLRSLCTDKRPKRNVLPCVVAFNGCVGSILDPIEEHITNQLPRVRSILQLQSLVVQPHQVLSTLDKINHSVRSASSDEAVISAVSDQVYETVSADGSMAGILRTLLERTSSPWLQKLGSDLGLVDDPAAAMDTRLEDTVDELSVELLSSTKSAQVQGQDSELLGFMGSEDRALIQEMKTSLRVLRKTLPQHPDDLEARKLFQDTLGTHAEPNLAKVMVHYDMNSAREATNASAKEEDLVWAGPNVQSHYLARTNVQMSAIPLGLDRQDDGLRTAVLTYCTTADSFNILTTSLVLDLSPIDRLRPALSAQNRHLNRSLLRHLFTNNLFHHLRLQYSYHFLASGEFVTRLSTALFSAETQSAERKRGTIPTGQTMGLRLGARNEQRWPPASSELRLTLMDVLTETYKADYPSFSKSRSSRELPGGLSFSIRELPEHDIERVMDPSSIYALDFLRLQYAAPAPLDAILTPASLQVYDAIFRHLLRLLRVLHVTTSLSRDVANRSPQQPSPPMARFAHQANAFITSLLSHMMDVGITAPWRSFTRRIEGMERSLRDRGKIAPVGIAALKQVHASYLDSIRSRLFLRKKQEKLRLAIEGVLSGVLKGAAAFESADDNEDQRARSEDATAEFERAVKDLLKLLRSAVDKPPKAKATTMNAMSDDVNDVNDDADGEMMRLLLERLDWNGFYSQMGSTVL